jgi:agmatine deiminase
MTLEEATTPRAAGFVMPAESSPHAATLMAWPVDRHYWQGRVEDARREYAAIARAVADFEPVIMVCDPDDERSVRAHCGSDVEVLPVPIDDSWMRDSGPIFVRNGEGRVAAVTFRFNAWGERQPMFARDDAMPYAIAKHLEMEIFTAPFVLEGGSIATDGEGTLLTTEMCLLNPNRNPAMSRDEIENGLRTYLGVDEIVWLPFGMAGDVGPVATDGHIDGVAHYVGAGRVLLLVPDDVDDEDYANGRANLERLQGMRDARGRPISVTPLVGANGANAYANCYVANGVVIAPTVGRDRDDEGLAQLKAAFPDREVIGIPSATIAFGGGGPHCVTQQVPAGPSA